MPCIVAYARTDPVGVSSSKKYAPDFRFPGLKGMWDLAVIMIARAHDGGATRVRRQVRPKGSSKEFRVDDC
jgi:hypothetical protein